MKISEITKQIDSIDARLEQLEKNQRYITETRNILKHQRNQLSLELTELILNSQW